MDLAIAFAQLDGGLGWPHDHDAADGFALLAAVEGRLEDAAVLVGHADAVHRHGTMLRDPISAGAMRRVAQILEVAMASGRRRELAEEGRALQPETAARLALPGWRT
ncbi:MAG: hypothetical protein JWQ07_2011 [Ramlibacter sp.]|nr:hypothetical protein [Ramlibacter sp.]